MGKQPQGSKFAWDYTANMKFSELRLPISDNHIVIHVDKSSLKLLGEKRDVTKFTEQFYY